MVDRESRLFRAAHSHRHPSVIDLLTLFDVSNQLALVKYPELSVTPNPEEEAG